MGAFGTLNLEYTGDETYPMPQDDECFPANAIVESKTRGTIKIVDVEIGEELMTLDGYSEVLFFAMNEPTVKTYCLEITAERAKIRLTASHGLFKDDKSFVLAGNLSVGDRILTGGAITDIQRKSCTGLVSPVTRAGCLIVDGVATSDYGPLAQTLGQFGAHAVVQGSYGSLKTFFPTLEIWEAKDEKGKSPIMTFGQALFQL